MYIVGERWSRNSGNEATQLVHSNVRPNWRRNNSIERLCVESSMNVVCCLDGAVGGFVRCAVRVVAMRGERGGRWNAMHRQVARCE